VCRPTLPWPIKPKRARHSAPHVGKKESEGSSLSPVLGLCSVDRVGRYRLGVA